MGFPYPLQLPPPRVRDQKSSSKSSSLCAAWPTSSCSRVFEEKRSISTNRFPADANTVRLFGITSGSRATEARGIHCHRFPHTFRIVRITLQRCLFFGSRSTDDHNRSALHGIPRWPLGQVLPRTQRISRKFTTLLFLFFISRSHREMQTVRTSDCLVGINIKISRDKMSDNGAHRTFIMLWTKRFHCFTVHNFPCR